MGELTSRSEAAEFEYDLRKFANTLEGYSAKLGKIHGEQTKQHLGSYYRGSGNEVIDAFSIYTGFTMVVSMLAQIVQQISELEQIASDEETDGMEESELYHTYGELFALKQMYMQLRNSVEVLEMTRVEYTAEGHHPRYFMTDILKSNGMPSVRDRRFNGGGLIVNGNITANQISYTGNIFAATVPVSAVAPPVPLLVP